MGAFAGYSSTRLYRQLKGQAWKKNTIMVLHYCRLCSSTRPPCFSRELSFPSFCSSTFSLPERNLLVQFLLVKFYLLSVDFAGTLMSLIALWFGVSVPLVFFGSYFALKKPIPENPVRTNQIPRQIPEQVWYMNPIFSILMGGILPFGAVFIELFFILSAIWGQQFYYIFGFLFIVFVILVLTCAEITIVMCYFQLCSEVSF